MLITILKMLFRPIPMKVFLARFLLAFMLVWLPLQGYALEAMSTCQRHHDHAAVAENSAHQGCHGEHSATAQSPSFLKANLSGCDDCASCHLIAQPALIVKPLCLGIDVTRPQQPAFSVTFSLFFPEQPQRPPLAFFS